MVAHLTHEDLLTIHRELVDMFEQDRDPIVPSGARDDNLLYSAVERPLTSLGDTEKYDTVDAKAAALFHSLIMNHPFHNGNKRTALMATLVFLDKNDRRVEASDDEVFDFVIAVASHAGDFSGGADDTVDRIERWFRDHSSPVRHEPREMRTADFLHSVKKAGGRYRQTRDKGSWVVHGPNGDSVTFRCSSKRLTGQVVKRYLHKLGIAESVSGIYASEFEEGVRSEQRLIRRYRTVLRRLSHA